MQAPPAAWSLALPDSTGPESPGWPVSIIGSRLAPSILLGLINRDGPPR
ncbi:MAG: hypothetical protein U5N21_11865 [Rhodococcus sp. (in: high G+C Gram-positive bacteria)]|nr:hypothetical protein [Rhodococcus sp. (in: high G+C Gram-positive bacteria)]